MSQTLKTPCQQVTHCSQGPLLGLSSLLFKIQERGVQRQRVRVPPDLARWLVIIPGMAAPGPAALPAPAPTHRADLVTRGENSHLLQTGSRLTLTTRDRAGLRLGSGTRGHTTLRTLLHAVGFRRPGLSGFQNTVRGNADVCNLYSSPIMVHVKSKNVSRGRA